MAKDLEIVKELKNGNTNRVGFFKEKIKEELKKLNINDDALVDEVLAKGIETYNETVKIPFLFHLKNIVKNLNNKEEKLSSLTKVEVELVSLYLNKEEDRYLSKIEITKRLKCSIDDIINVFKNKEEEILKVFPNYKERIREREEYFSLKSTTLSSEQISLIEQYVGAFNEPLSINELANKYNLSRKDMAERLVKAFKILSINNNLALLLDKYPDIKDTVLKAGKDLGINLEYTESISKKNSIVSTDFKRRVRLNKEDFIMLKLLESYQNKEISISMIKENGFTDIFDFINRRSKFFSKIISNNKILEDIKNVFPNLDIEKLRKSERLTVAEFKTLLTLYKYQDEKIPLEVIAEKEEIQDLASFRSLRTRVITKLKKSSYLLDRVLLIIPDFDFEKIKHDYSRELLTKDDMILLELLNRYSDVPLLRIVEIGGYESESTFRKKKSDLLKKINENKRLYEIVKKLFPNIKSSESVKVKGLSDKNIKLLSLLEKHKDKPLNNNEMAMKLGLANSNSFIACKNTLFRSLRESEELKREALRYFPGLNIDSNINLTFTNNEISFLDQYCLVKDNRLIYQSIEEIGIKLNISEYTVEYVKEEALNKIIKGIEEDINLDILLWPNFLDEFIIRDNFKEENSVLLNYGDLKRMDEYNSLSKAVSLLDESIFKDYVSSCSYEDKVKLALRLGYFNQFFFSSSDVANILDVDEVEVALLTKECLNKSRDVFVKSKVKKLSL